jgi:hypothetical protein
VTLRDRAERIIRSWDAYERKRGTPPIIDYDCYPKDATVDAATSRLKVFEALQELASTPEYGTQSDLQSRVDSDLTYLRALMGERLPLDDYVYLTQGCHAAGWPDKYLTYRGEQAREHLAAVGVGWHAETMTELATKEGRLELDAVPDVVRSLVAELEPTVRALTGTQAPFTLTIENVNVDAYWSYWLDGAGENARMRLNLKNAVFTKVTALAFTLHEIFGHALQGASFSARAAADDVPWVRLLSVHAPQQTLLEGLAQALPLFVIPDDELAMARLRLVHYTQLVRADLHRMVNAGAPVERCVARARALTPFWSDEVMADVLSDRGVNPQLRSYLWAYPAGLDWFVALAEAGQQSAGKVLRAAYRDPLAPGQLAELWPNGPAFGGPGTTA